MKFPSFKKKCNNYKNPTHVYISETIQKVYEWEDVFDLLKEYGIYNVNFDDGVWGKRIICKFDNDIGIGEIIWN
jgi:hypothetical protein